MITTSDLTWMRQTENQAMSSVAYVYKLTYTESALGATFEQWILDTTTIADVWPIKQGMERSSGNQEISNGEFYISLPYDTAVSVQDVIKIDNVTYEVTFVPLAQSWLTNLRVEARNYNGSNKFEVEPEASILMTEDATFLTGE